VFFSDLSTTIGNIHSGRLRALAMAWPTRSPQLPETPTFSELGYPSVVSSSWFGLAAPVETSADIIMKLHQATTQTFANPAYQTAIKKLGNEQFTLNPAQSKAFIKGEVDKWASVAKSANIQIE
jgi:tripartite-type tricarboxylate transporter receptor subunit TctC